MGKIKLSNEQELSIIADVIQAAGDSLTISLTADKTIAECDEIFSEAMNTKKITVLDSAGEPFMIHSGYTKLQSVEKLYDTTVDYNEDEDGNKVPVTGTAIRVSLIRPDKTEQRIASLEDTVDTLTMEYETIKRLYAKTKNKSVVEKALAKGWITEEEKNAILAEEA